MVLAIHTALKGDRLEALNVLSILETSKQSGKTEKE